MRKERRGKGQKKVLQVTSAFQPYRPADEVTGNVSCRVSMEEISRKLNPQQTQAIMRGIAEVIAAANGRK